MMPRILLVVPRLNIGGAESYVVTTAQGLLRRGYHVVVASWGGQWVAQLTATGIAHYLVPIRLNAYLASLFLQRIIIKEQIQLVHANAAAAAEAALQACQREKLPLVYTAHGVFGHTRAELQLAQAERIICVSECLRNLVIEKGVAPEPLRTVYNGIDYQHFAPDAACRYAVRSKFGFQEDELVLGIVSRIKNIEDKGHADILRMLAAYKQQQRWRFLVVGKGRGENALLDLARQLGVEERLVMAGHHTDVSPFIQAMDVMLLPSKFETFGLVLVEAMAAGKPVIGYKIGGIPEAIAHEETGFVIPPGDIEEMYTRLQWLAEEPLRRQTMGLRGVERVKSLFSQEKMLNELEGIYAEAIASKKG